jgi:hypothetical protein
VCTYEFSFHHESFDVILINTHYSAIRVLQLSESNILWAIDIIDGQKRGIKIWNPILFSVPHSFSPAHSLSFCCARIRLVCSTQHCHSTSYHSYRPPPTERWWCPVTTTSTDLDRSARTDTVGPEFYVLVMACARLGLDLAHHLFEDELDLVGRTRRTLNLLETTIMWPDLSGRISDTDSSPILSAIDGLRGPFPSVSKGK